jgi:hypothetical protein
MLIPARNGVRGYGSVPVAHLRNRASARNTGRLKRKPPPGILITMPLLDILPLSDTLRVPPRLLAFLKAEPAGFSVKTESHRRILAEDASQRVFVD